MDQEDQEVLRFQVSLWVQVHPVSKGNIIITFHIKHIQVFNKRARKKIFKITNSFQLVRKNIIKMDLNLSLFL